MAETINDGQSEIIAPKPHDQGVEARVKQLSERFRPEVIDDRVRDIFANLGIKSSPSLRNPNHMKFDLPKYLIAQVNGGAPDERGSPDWNTWTWDSGTVSVKIQKGLIVERDRSGEETTFDLKLADVGLRVAGYLPTTDGGISFPKYLTLRSENTGTEYRGKIKGASPISEIQTRIAGPGERLFIDIRFADGSSDSFSLVKEQVENLTTERILVTSTLAPNRADPVDMQVNNDRSKVIMNVNGNQFTLTRKSENQYEDNYGNMWIARKQVIGPMFFIQQR